MDTVYHLLEDAARRHPATALTWSDGRTRTYADFLSASRRCAAALAHMGVRKGDRVALWLPNSEAHLDFLLGTMQLGAIAVAVNTRYRAAEAGAIIAHTRPAVLVIEPGFHGISFSDILAAIDPAELRSVTTLIVCGAETPAHDLLPGRRTFTHAWALEQAPSDAIPDAADDCAIFTTSGTTSGPKHAVHTHGSIARHARDAAHAFGYDATDAVLLHTLPFCGIYGFSQLTATLAAGARSFFMSVFDAAACARLMQEHRVTHTSGTDDLLKRALDAVPGERPFPALRECVYAGFNPALALFPEQAEQRGMRLIGCFGMSEIHSFFSRQDGHLPVLERKRPGGTPISRGVQVRARDPASGAIQPHGEPGELEIRSANLFSYYFGQAEATRAAFTPDGYFRTGDLGRTLADGRYEFLGRRGDFMRLGGFMVNPLEIELELQELAGIETAIVVDAPAPGGTRAVAFVKLRAGQAWDEERLRAHCVARLANFKVPSLFVRVDTFPSAMSPNGEKIQRGKLKARAAELVEPRHPAPHH
ncbi:AMP-binding protein [Castellaniella sp. GW247-6E4]|uniref:AMP-binding protein n=1 Tax=Castellaniella sp. GW247-6E4 TaxID=3140380 RepID=UPI003315A101